MKILLFFFGLSVLGLFPSISGNEGKLGSQSDGNILGRLGEVLSQDIRVVNQQISSLIQGQFDSPLLQCPIGEGLRDSAMNCTKEIIPSDDSTDGHCRVFKETFDCLATELEKCSTFREKKELVLAFAVPTLASFLERSKCKLEFYPELVKPGPNSSVTDDPHEDTSNNGSDPSFKLTYLPKLVIQLTLVSIVIKFLF